MTRPSDEDITNALDIENTFGKEHLDLYMQCMDNKPMSKRITDVELRDGCIITWHVFMKCINAIKP